MLLGALVDAGVPFTLLEETAAALDVGARLEMRKVSRGGIAGTKVDVLTPDSPAPADAHSHNHEHHSHEPHTHDAHGRHTHPAPAAIAPVAHTHIAHRSLSTILAIIRATSLSDDVKQRATRFAG